MTSTFSYSSAHNSRSTETLRTMTGTGHDDVFVPGSLNSSITTNTNRISGYYLEEVTKAIPGERPEYQQQIASAIKDANDKCVADFLR
jgi:hypothetical protein